VVRLALVNSGARNSTFNKFKSYSKITLRPGQMFMFDAEKNSPDLTYYRQIARVHGLEIKQDKKPSKKPVGPVEPQI